MLLLVVVVVVRGGVLTLLLPLLLHLVVQVSALLHVGVLVEYVGPLLGPAAAPLLPACASHVDGKPHAASLLRLPAAHAARPSQGWECSAYALLHARRIALCTLGSAYGTLLALCDRVKKEQAL